MTFEELFIVMLMILLCGLQLGAATMPVSELQNAFMEKERHPFNYWWCRYIMGHKNDCVNQELARAHDRSLFSMKVRCAIEDVFVRHPFSTPDFKHTMFNLCA